MWKEVEEERSIRLERRRGGEKDAWLIEGRRRGEGGIETGAADEEGVEEEEGRSEVGSSTNARGGGFVASNGSLCKSCRTRSSRASCARRRRSATFT